MNETMLDIKITNKIKKKIKLQIDEDYWQEIKVKNIYYDCNIYDYEYHDPVSNSYINIPTLKVVDVYKTKDDINNPGFKTTDMSTKLDSFIIEIKHYTITESFNKTLVIPNVNFEKLEEQRKVLQDLLLSKHRLSKKRYNSLLGILNMLNNWSDSLYNSKNYK